MFYQYADIKCLNDMCDTVHNHISIGIVDSRGTYSDSGHSGKILLLYYKEYVARR